MAAAQDVLTALAEATAEEERDVESFFIRAVNPLHYVARVYFTGEPEYEGYAVELEPEPES